MPLNNPNIEANQKRFKKGQSGNPKGRPRKSKLTREILQELKDQGYTSLTASDMREMYTTLLELSEDQLKALTSDKQASMISRVIAKQILGKYGFDTIEKMLDRAIGKPTQKTELSGNVQVSDFSVGNVLNEDE